MDVFYDEEAGQIWLNEINTLLASRLRACTPPCGKPLALVCHSWWRSWWSQRENEPTAASAAAMMHGLLWIPLLLAFVMLAALGWLERRRQNLFRVWSDSAELAKLDGCGAAKLKDGELCWSSFPQAVSRRKGAS